MTRSLFPGNHPDVAITLNNLAKLYYSQGRYRKAKLLYGEALAMCEGVLGVDHPTTVRVRDNLAALLTTKRYPFNKFRHWLLSFF